MSQHADTLEQASVPTSQQAGPLLRTSRDIRSGRTRVGMNSSIGWKRSANATQKCFKSLKRETRPTHPDRTHPAEIPREIYEPASCATGSHQL